MAALLEASHWQARSVAPQVVTEETAAEMQGTAQSGRAAFTTPEKATKAKAATEYFMLIDL